MGAQLLPVKPTGSVDLHDVDGDRVALYSSTGALVGRISPASWEIGDLDTPGLRATLDPAGGLRFRSTTSELLNLVDQQGMSIRDEATGIITSELSRDRLRLIDPTGGNDIVLSTVQATTLATPRYAGVTEIAPSNTVVAPLANVLTTNDLELCHVAAFKRATVQAATWTPPAGFTEVIDNDYGVADTLATSVGSRGPAVGAANTFTSSQTNWDEAAGTHVVVRGDPLVTTPIVRSTSQLESTTSGSAATLVMNKPAGTVQGDVLIVFISMGNSGGTVPVGWVTPAGWVYLGAQVSITGSGATMSMLAVGCWAKLCGATEPATYQTTINFGVGVKTMHASLICVQGSTSTPAGQQFNIGGYNLAGSWLNYTPTNVNLTIGTGTQTARYLQMGKTVFVRWQLASGATTTINGPLQVGLPVPVGPAGTVFTGWLRNVGIAGYAIGGTATAGQTSVTLQFNGSGSSVGIINTGSPFTIISGDHFAIQGVYETA